MCPLYQRHIITVLTFVVMTMPAHIGAGTAGAAAPGLRDRCAYAGNSDAAGDGWNVELLGRWAAGPCLAAAVRGDTAYFGNGAWLEIVDFSTPSAPVELGKVTVPGLIEDVSLSGNYACAKMFSEGFSVIDVSAPSNPVEVGFYTGQCVGYSIAAAGDYAYVTAYGTGLVIVDISTPSNPTEVGSYQTGHHPFPEVVVVSDNFAYLVEYGLDPLDAPPGLTIIDVSTPSSPFEVGHYYVYHTYDVAVSGNHAYLASADTIRVIDVSTPSNPAEVGVYNTPFGVGGITATPDYAFVAHRDGLRVLDISSPANPFEVGFYDTPAAAEDVTCEGNHVYASGGSSLRVFDVSTPSSPTEDGFFNTADYTHDIVVLGNYAFVRNSGLRVIDVSDPSNAHEVGLYSVESRIYDIAAADGHAYLAQDFDGLRVIDISAPLSPIEVGFYETGERVQDVAVADNYACVVSGEGELCLIDVSTPAAPFELARYDHPDPDVWFRDLAIAGNHVYATAGEYGLRVIDINTPSNPVEIASCVPWAQIEWVTLSGDYAYLADFNFGGICVVDISTPSSPTLVGDYDAPGSVHDLAVSGGLAYVANYSSDAPGLRVLDVSTPSDINEIGYYITESGVVRLAFANGNAYLTTGYAGLYILKYSPGVPVSLQALNATAVGRTIRITWTVSEETDLDGYRTYRVLDGSGDRSVLTRTLIPADGHRRYQYTDYSTTPNTDYNYTLVAVERDGSEQILGTTSARSGGPAALSLGQNVPNPFNPSTSISFELPERAAVELSIYDVEGRLVKTLTKGIESAGAKTYRWDGRDNNGNPVASGVYVYKLQAGKQTLSRKMTLLR